MAEAVWDVQEDLLEFSRIREFELNWQTDPAILALYMQQHILSSGLPLGDLCWLGNYDNLLKVCNIALW